MWDTECVKYSGNWGITKSINWNDITQGRKKTSNCWKILDGDQGII